MIIQNEIPLLEYDDSSSGVIAHRSLGLDDHYYIYYCENHGFGEYNIFMRVEDLEEEDD